MTTTNKDVTYIAMTRLVEDITRPPDKSVTWKPGVEIIEGVGSMPATHCFELSLNDDGTFHFFNMVNVNYQLDRKQARELLDFLQFHLGDEAEEKPRDSVGFVLNLDDLEGLV